MVVEIKSIPETVIIPLGGNDTNVITTKTGSNDMIIIITIISDIRVK